MWGNYDGSPVFTRQEVFRVNHVWEYSPLKKWFYSVDMYDFSAYTPADAASVNVVDNRISSIDCDCFLSQADLMMAYTTVPRTDIGKPVHLEFNHVLAAVNFSFKLKEGYDYVNTYKVLDIKWDDIYTKNRFYLNSDNTFTFSPLGTLGESITTTSFSGGTFTTTNAMVSDYIFIPPQTLSSATLIFTLNINGENHEIVKTVSDINWEPGERYTYYVTFDPYEITIKTTPWEKPEIGDIEIQ